MVAGGVTGPGLPPVPRRGQAGAPKTLGLVATDVRLSRVEQERALPHELSERHADGVGDED